QELLTRFANGELPAMDLLMTHAEDQLMSAEAFGILAERFITLYRKING
ncbi:MAG: PTS lactose/cellobiose transporter subunit IIA, partial [Erysipelotrichaceae bacterium]|nr:PTS lactose/cellobiose transporter subunit IIA [Erysipelotrichaceae bacterium]